MSDEADRRAILARRTRFIAAALAGLGGCTPEAKPPPGGVAILPAALASYSAPPPPVDSDKDGVLDEYDECPSIPAGDRQSMDHPGCPQPQVCLSINPYATVQIFAKIHFGRLSPRLHPRSASMLDEIAAILKQSPKLDLDVLGHCEKGEPKSLAKQRAEAVRDGLVARGIEAERLRMLDGVCEAPGEDSRIVEFPSLHERQKNPGGTE